MTVEAPAKYEPRDADFLRVQGGKMYLPVPQRVQWFRGEHPDWSINTSIVELQWEAGYAIIRAEVLDASGRLIASGMKTETRKGFGDFVEKAETGAVGRALARVGYGTEDALDLEGDRFADAPIEQPGRQRGGEKPSSPNAAAPVPRPPEEEEALRELLELVHSRAQLDLLADAVGVPEGRRATLGELRAMINLAKEPLSPEPSGWPKPGTAAYKALSAYEQATARDWWKKHKADEPPDEPPDD